jgi:hypothetical protein
VHENNPNGFPTYSQNVKPSVHCSDAPQSFVIGESANQEPNTLQLTYQLNDAYIQAMRLHWLGQTYYTASTAIKRESIARLRTQQAIKLSTLTQLVNAFRICRWYWTEHAFLSEVSLFLAGV